MQRKKKNNNNNTKSKSLLRSKKLFSLPEYYIWLPSNNSPIGNINFKLRVISFHILKSSACLFVNTKNFIFNQLSASVINKYCSFLHLSYTDDYIDIYVLINKTKHVVLRHKVVYTLKIVLKNVM